MKLLTLKRDVTSQLRTQNCLNGPKNAGARTPGLPEPARTPPKRTLSSPSRPASRRAWDSACVSSGSRRKFFKRRKSLLSSLWLAAKPLSSRSRVEPSQTEAEGRATDGPVGTLRWSPNCISADPGGGGARGAANVDPPPCFSFSCFSTLFTLHLVSFKFK